MAPRETIWTTLLSILRTALVAPAAPGVNQVYRRLMTGDQLSEALLPAIAILELDEERGAPPGTASAPQRITMKGELWIYTFVADQNAPTTPPLNNILDAIDTALNPIPGIAVGAPTLNGLVTRVIVGGVTKITEGLEQGQALGIVPIDIVATV